MAIVFLLITATVASGTVWTDEEDYAPGSVVTLSGNNSNGAGYLAGEPVAVQVWGPNGFTASCDGVADEAGAWSCQITLWSDERAVGDYTYTATGANSGVSENGVFADSHVVTTITGGPMGTVAATTAVFTWTVSVGGAISQCQLEKPAGVIQEAFAPCTSPKTYMGLTSGSYTFKVRSRLAMDPGGQGVIVSRTWTVAANTAPTTPGIPALTSGSNPNNTGLFGLGWTASTDAESNPLTYVLEHRDADDAGFSNVASGLGTNAYTFTGAGEGEGTWTYRAQASDGSLSSAFSGASLPIVVDKSAPNAPSVTADRAPDYTGDGGWYLDTVTVSTSANGDPNLQDGSAGSGVNAASVASPVVRSTSGSHTSTESVSDNAGNTSMSSSLTVQVDATKPTVGISCPTGKLIMGSSASASWMASDAHSGLATAPSGSVALDTSTIGTHTATAPTATDNVGHASNPATCSYSVIYNFNGFFRPVDNLPKWNLVKAGSAIPVKFSLNGDQGLGIFGAGFPKSAKVPCQSNAPMDNIEETVTAGSSSLSYDATADQYNYVWKTDKSWGATCRVLTVTLADGQSYTAYFNFTK